MGGPLRPMSASADSQDGGLTRVQGSARSAHQSLVALLPLAILVTDGHGVIRSGNSAAAATLRVRPERLLGEPLFRFVEPGDQPRLRELVTPSVSTDPAPRRALVGLVTSDGTTLATEVAAILDAEHDGQVEITWVLLGAPRAGDRVADAGSRLAAALVALTRVPLDLERTPLLRRVAEACQGAFQPPVAVSVTLGDPREPETVGTDSKLAQLIDGAQVVAGEGPCAHAWQTRDTVRTERLDADERWPDLARLLPGGDQEPAYAVAVPLLVDGQMIGVLNTYGENQRLTDDEAVDNAEQLATAVAALLHEVEVRAKLASAADQLQTALESRATIDQAKGIVMAREGCGPDEAFALLAAESSRRNIKLRDLAEQLVHEVAHGGEPTS